MPVITYTKAEHTCILGQESAIFKIQHSVGSSAV